MFHRLLLSATIPLFVFIQPAHPAEQHKPDSPIIIGTVSDSKTSLPIAGIQIEVFDSSGTAVASAYSDKSGKYRIPLKTSGSFYIRTFDVEQKYADELYDSLPCCYICSDYVPCNKRCDVHTGKLLTVSAATTVNFSLDPGSGCKVDEVKYPASYTLFSERFDDINSKSNWGSWEIQSGKWEIQAAQLLNKGEDARIVFTLHEPGNYQKEDICTLTARVKFATAGTVVSLSSWYIDETNNLDFVMEEEPDQCTTLQTIQSKTTIIQKGQCELNIGEFYKVHISLERNDFSIYIKDDVSGFQETPELQLTEVNKGSLSRIPWGRTSIRVIAGTAYFDDVELSQFVDLIVIDKSVSQ